MRISHLTRGGFARRRRETFADETGSFLIEAMVSAVLVLVIGAGVLAMTDRGSQINAQQKVIATAGNLAQSEQETLRAYSTSKEGLAYLSNLRRTVTPAPTVGLVSYTVTSRTDWINDPNGSPSCTNNAGADYMKLTTTVTAPPFAERPPVVLETLITPSARAFDANQGSLAVQVNNRDGVGVPGLTLNLTGPKTLSDSTSSTGCILWGYLPAGGGYTVNGSRGGWVQPSSAATIAQPASVTGDQTTNVSIDYDEAGGLSVDFVTKRTASTSMSTAPQKAIVEHSSSAFSPKPFTVTGSHLGTGLVLFPFTSPYTIYADGCVPAAAAKPPALGIASALAPRAGTSAAVTIQLPALNINVKNNGANVNNATIKVTSPCGGNTYTRHTNSAGIIDDPGFPYGSLQSVCVSDAANTRKRVVGTVANTTYPVTDVTYDIGTTGSTTGACP